MIVVYFGALADFFANFSVAGEECAGDGSWALARVADGASPKRAR